MKNKKNKKTIYHLYTDGACNNCSQKKEGGYAFMILDSQMKVIRTFSDAEFGTTNNKMELKAIIEGCKCIKSGSEVYVYSDSQYALGVLSGKWRAKLNLDIIALHQQNKDRLTIHYKWVKGHSGNAYNAKCDEMANKKMCKLVECTKSHHKTVVLETEDCVTPPSCKRICRLSDDEYKILQAFRDGNLKYKFITPPKPKRTPLTPEQKKERKRAYYQSHKEERKAYATQYYQDHKEECKSKQRKYYVKKKQQYISERSACSQA